MSDIELFEFFQNLCKEYVDTYDAIILEKNDNCFKVFKPSSENETFIIFESSTGSARHQGSASNIQDLLENAI